MKAMYRIVTPAAASAVAVLLLTACADKPVRIPGGSFVEDPYSGETTSRTQTIQSNGDGTLAAEIIYTDETASGTQTSQPGGSGAFETEVIYIENDVPVGPVQGGQQGGKPGVTDQELQPVQKSNAPEGSVEYKVVKGDTLWGIGMVYGVSVARLAEINGIDEKAPLKIGQVLMIPPDAKNAVGKPIPQKKADETKATTTKPATTTTKPASSTAKAQPVAKDGETLYVVKKGDSLSVIAQRHHVKLADLVAANKLDPNAILRIGQTLVIPAAGKTTTASSTTTTKPATTTAANTTTKPATATTTKTEPAATTTTKSATTTTTKAGEGTGGVVEPIGGSSAGVTSAATSKSATQPASSSLPALDPVSAIPDTDVIAVPIDSESTLEEVANIHDRNLEDLIRLNPEFKPGQKIPAGTAVKMPLF